MNARQQYLEELGKEYGRADEKCRGRLLDEAEKRPILSAPSSFGVAGTGQSFLRREREFVRTAELGAAAVAGGWR
ncbi:MAG: hypothetical protein ABSE56_06975 [Bryobacteraceae bacterium]|jgi:hypothetical protein